MGEYKVRSSVKAHSARPGTSNLTALLQNAPAVGNATLVRCPDDTLSRLHKLNTAEFITLFTPFVPHPPSTALAKNMDPFEPLGRSLPRQVRHVPYRLDRGMTEMHTDFLQSSGAIVVVICSPENVLAHNSKAFEQQLKFSKDVVAKIEENASLNGVPVVLLLVTNGVAESYHQHGVEDFPALVTLNEYSPAALENSVRALFDK